MQRHSKIFRLALAAATSGLALATAAPALAQPAGAPGQQAEINPPTRVGGLARLSGTVSFHTADQDEWSPAVLNYPVTQGDAFWTQPGAQAQIDISDTSIALNATTELDTSTLNDQNLTATLPQGEAYLRVRDLLPGESYTIVTPRGAVSIASPGRYDIVAGDTQAPTLVTVLDGTATLSDGISLQVTAGQTAEIAGDQAPFQGQLVPAMRDPFVAQMLARAHPVVARGPAPPPLVAQMPGGAELAEYGSWSQTPQYGDVWYPQVASGWVPYREGHWAYVAPWGWTWVDSDPWGFAPFHYGRWVDVGGRWGWMPGIAVAAGPPAPVYAPALVTFFGIGAAVGVGVGIGAGAFGGSVGWVPLGPGEVYHPWFHASPNYVRDVNIRHVNVTQITDLSNTTVNNVTINQFRNRPGATVVPATAMATSRPIAQVAQRVTPQELAQARPVVGHPPVPPTTATMGVTPAVARQIHAVPPPAGVAVAARPAAPGPVIHAQATAPLTAHPAQPGRPGIPPGTQHAAPSPNAPATAARPHEAAPGPVIQHAQTPTGVPHPTPALRTPGAVPGHPGEMATEHAPAAVHARPGETTPALAAPGAAQARPGELHAAPARPIGATPTLRAPGSTPEHPAASIPRELHPAQSRPAPGQENRRPMPPCRARIRRPSRRIRRRRQPPMCRRRPRILGLLPLRARRSQPRSTRLPRLRTRRPSPARHPWFTRPRRRIRSRPRPRRLVRNRCMLPRRRVPLRHRHRIPRPRLTQPHTSRSGRASHSVFRRPAAAHGKRPAVAAQDGPLSRQGEGHHRIAELRAHPRVAAGCDHHELPSARDIGHRRGLTAGRQIGLPQQGAGREVEGV